MTNSPASPARAALKRLIIIVVLAISIGIFSYGWSVTDINLAIPQEPRRQQNVGEAMRELFSPNIFEQDYTFEESITPFLVSCATGESPAATTPTTDGTPYIIVSPA